MRRRSDNIAQGGWKVAQNHGTAAIIRADFKCGSSICRYAKSIRTGRNLGDAMDGAGAPGHRWNCRTQSSAYSFFPIYNARKSPGQAGPLATIFYQMGVRDPFLLAIVAA